MVSVRVRPTSVHNGAGPNRDCAAKQPAGQNLSENNQCNDDSILGRREPVGGSVPRPSERRWAISTQRAFGVYCRQILCLPLARSHVVSGGE